ncbi:MAG: prepilin-type N-terminal cleavage/methylation domain-containing protein [Patescibacteria group bacterium]|nr:prepilin-type N-terminal cleavage/methylation domain-containing protein [Patescibacteria group bacterium]MCX7589746.1 prepilin-type N-terminal cleavage/methylation domain-containing protein [Patescibacteria group bacterium]MDW8279650.1 prepilin-type N-terminal cleavage/methylation domain-containing protein [bacterium]
MHRFKWFKINFKKNKAFSLIEILISISLLTIILAIIIPIWNFELINKKNQNINVASRIASSQLEELKNLKFNNLPNEGSINFNHPDLSKLNQGTGIIYVENYQTGTNQTLKQIKIQIIWKDNQTSTYEINYLFLK